MTTLLNSPSTTVEEQIESAPTGGRTISTKQSGVPGPTNVLLSNIVWMLLGNVAYGFSQWALLVALAKLGTIEMVGHFSLAIAIALPVFMFSSLTLRSLQVTDALRAYRFFEYGALRLVTAGLSVVFIIVASVVSRYSTPLFIATALIAAAKAAEYISDILYGLLQQEEDMSGIAISMILRSILSVVVFGITVYITHSLVWASASLFVCSTAVLCGYDVPKAVAGRKARLAEEVGNFTRYCSQLVRKESRQRLGKLALTGLPMGFALMVVSLNLSIPRYFIQRYLGMTELGIFSAIATLLASGSVAINAIGQAAAPRMAKAFAQRENRKFSLLLFGLVGASLGMGILGLLGSIFFGRQAMTLIYRPEYSTRQDLLIWLMAASGLYYLGSILGYAVTAVRCYGPQLPLFIIAAVTTATGCIYLIPKMGLQGAAAAILLSAVIQCVGSMFLLHRAVSKARTQPSLVLQTS
jgi:O-antigen/teichoic acid export membrane protein